MDAVVSIGLAVFGVVVAVIAALAISGQARLWWWRRRQRRLR